MSTEKNNGGPAFPMPGADYHDENGELIGNYSQSGMSLRAWFAGLAMQGMLNGVANPISSEIAVKSFDVADAMIARLRK